MRRTRRGLTLGSLALSLLALLLVAGASASVAQESWDAVYLSGAKVGFIHTYITPVKDRGRDLFRVRVDMELQFKRDKDKVTIKTEYGTIEAPDGKVLRLETHTYASNQMMRTSGDVIDDKITLTLEGGGQNQQVTIPWGPDVRGPYAAEQSLSRQPIKPGESRSLRMYIPDLNKICEIALSAKREEEVLLGGGKRSLLRVEQNVALEGKPRPEYSTTLWVDSGGQVLKSRAEILGGMDIYRTTREAAKGTGGTAQLDLLVTSIIRVVHKIDKPDASRNIVYRVTFKDKDEDPAQVLPTDRRQKLRPGTAKGSAVLEVKTAGPNDGTAGPERVDAEFLRPNALITSQDATVVALAAKAVANAVAPWDKAVRIEHWVAENLKNKNFGTAFAPAGEVAQSLAGDCTEHSVLAAAMCRAQGIPARVVVGLVYANHLGGFGFHMWNEAYVNRRWVALDSAFDQSSVDAVHIKLSDSSLDGVSPYESFLPVVRVMGKMTLEPLEIR